MTSHTPDPAAPGELAVAGEPQSTCSLLSEDPAGLAGAAVSPDGDYLSDLRLDQVIAAVAGDREERDLVAGLMSARVRDAGTVRYRHEVFRDLEDPDLLPAMHKFAASMREVRAHLRQTAKMRSAWQQRGWFLDAAALYTQATRSLSQVLVSSPLSSRGLTAFRDYLAGYLNSAEFAELAANVADCRKQLAEVTYLVRIKGPRVEVSRYDGEPDYSAEIEATFERFRQGAVADYKVSYRAWPGMNHVGAQILDLVARLFSDEFSALEQFSQRHAEFLDATVRQFERELQFYLAYLGYIEPLRAAGLGFCLPELTEDSKEIFARDAFDLALAAKLTADGKAVVANDVELCDPERVIVVSGPNQGGKTTFARAFGQLHHLAATGCPVPGSAARLYLCDRIFTHFEREEDLANLTGKLEDDLLRIQKVMRAATPRSIVIMNEIFTSTTLSDARFLGQQVLRKIVGLDLLAVYVTFIDELADYGPAVVSMTSMIVPDDPAQRTFRVLRRPADGLAYALAIADKHRVTYGQLRARISS